MKIKDYKCNECESKNFFMREGNSPSIIGIYCKQCGKWLKWANKNEKNLFSNKERS